MADYKFTQTGAEIQALLNKADGLPAHLYKHSITIQGTVSSAEVSGDSFYVKAEVFNSSSTQFDKDTFHTYLSNLPDKILANGTIYIDSTDINTGIIQYLTAGGTNTLFYKLDGIVVADTNKNKDFEVSVTVSTGVSSFSDSVETIY